MKDAERAKIAGDLSKKTMDSFKAIFDPKKGMITKFFPGNRLVEEFEAKRETKDLEDFSKDKNGNFDKQGMVNKNFYENGVKNGLPKEKLATNAEILDIAYGISMIENEAQSIPYRVATNIFDFHDKDERKEQREKEEDYLLNDIIQIQKTYGTLVNCSKQLVASSKEEGDFNAYLANIESVLGDIGSKLDKMIERHKGNKEFYQALNKLKKDMDSIKDTISPYKKYQRRSSIDKDQLNKSGNESQKEILNNYFDANASTASTVVQLTAASTVKPTKEPTFLAKILPNFLVNALSGILPKSLFEKESAPRDPLISTFEQSVAVEKYKSYAKSCEKSGGSKEMIEKTNAKIASIKAKIKTLKDPILSSKMSKKIHNMKDLDPNAKVKKEIYNKIVEVNKLKIEVDAALVPKNGASGPSKGP